jgi:SRSO17 transposase
LRRAQEQLLAQGSSRYPQRSDFTEDEVVAIKAHLGPWPRALEAAGLKPVRDADGQRAAQQKERRIRQKLLRRQAKQNKD